PAPRPRWPSLVGGPSFDPSRPIRPRPTEAPARPPSAPSRPRFARCPWRPNVPGGYDNGLIIATFAAISDPAYDDFVNLFTKSGPPPHGLTVRPRGGIG